MRDALAGFAVDLQHIGSTSIPGLAAKPTIDILVGARSLAINFEALSAMDSLAYEHRGELGVPGRRYFRKGRSYPRDFNVHLVVFAGQLWHDSRVPRLPSRPSRRRLPLRRPQARAHLAAAGSQLTRLRRGQGGVHRRHAATCTAIARHAASRRRKGGYRDDPDQLLIGRVPGRHARRETSQKVSSCIGDQPRRLATAR